MSANYSICIGTIGTGAWLSPDGGDSWRRIASPNGLWGESRVYAHDSPHSQMAPNICAKRGWAASIWANRSMSGSRRKSVMFGMSS